MNRIEDIVTDSEGEPITIGDTIATERIEDMPAEWLELHTWLQGFPARLIAIGYKRLNGEPLDAKERKYISRLKAKRPDSDSLRLF